MCKHGDGACPDYYYCWRCERERKETAWKRMTPAQSNYDRYVDPLGAYTAGLSAPGGDDHLWRTPPRECSCHINPPCSFCTDAPAEDDAE